MAAEQNVRYYLACIARFNNSYIKFLEIVYCILLLLAVSNSHQREEVKKSSGSFLDGN